MLAIGWALSGLVVLGKSRATWISRWDDGEMLPGDYWPSLVCPVGGEIKGWGMEFDVLDRFAKYARQGQCDSDVSGQTARPRRVQ